MAPRAVGAALGLLAFSTTIVSGLWVRNPVTVTLSRALWAMLVFCLIGLVLGWAGELVVREHIREREKAVFGSEETEPDDEESNEEQFKSTEAEAEPMGT